MIQKIGKYNILERIGRGGMGTVFKAHDPVLNRTVALKVISHDIEVTEELRARFFREAQACARLSHPSIVTVYDMGEDEERLFIVMEFLEGDELRHLIAQRRSLPLEDKLAVMIRVCDGLHYAHEMGVVHRDIKPGNIIVLRSGFPKLLDFGIAQVASADGGLTRTGLIMGTLRYISPEQARGRADRRSDIFSLGAVFYEFLAYRPAFAGDDPIQILEQVRSENPPPLPSIDASIPPELDAVIGRAMDKDPSRRFQDLADMRAHLEHLQQQLARERVTTKLDRLRELYGQLGEADIQALETTPRLGTRPPLDAIELMERDVAGRLARAQNLVERIRALSPRVERGLEHVRAGQYELAVAELNAVVTEMPEHARAAAILRDARVHLEAERQRRIVERRLDDVDKACDRGALTAGLEILREIREAAASVGMADQFDLRYRAVTQAQERRQLRHVAESAQATMAEARARAASLDAAQRAATLWSDAEALANHVVVALDRADFTAAQAAAEGARDLFCQAEEIAQNVLQQEERWRLRRLAESARSRMVEGRARAAGIDAERRAESLWREAEARAQAAGAALAQEEFTAAQVAADSARELFGEAEAVARGVLDREEFLRHAAESAQSGMVESRARAVRVDAAKRAGTLWREGEARAAAVGAALAREDFEAAQAAAEGARDLFRQAEAAARGALQQEERRRLRGGAESAQSGMVESRARAVQVDAAGRAGTLWREAEARAAAVGAALAREDFETAQAVAEGARDLFRQAEAAARGALQQEERRRLRGGAESAQSGMVESRARAVQVDAAGRAGTLWREGEARAAAVGAALAREDFEAAQAVAEGARDLFRQAEAAARGALQQEERRRLREGAESAQSGMVESRARAVQVDAAGRAGTLWREGEARAAAVSAALAREDFEAAQAVAEGARDLFRQAEEAARDISRGEEDQRPRPGEPQEDVTGARTRAMSADATSLWTEAESITDRTAPVLQPWSIPGGAPSRHRGGRLFRREADERAPRTFLSRPKARVTAAGALLLMVAVVVFLVWLSVRPSEDPRRGELATLRDQVGTIRRDAVSVDAERLVPAAFRSAETAEGEAAQALAQQRYTDAHAAYTRALTGFQRAAADARDISARIAQEKEAEAALSKARAARADAEKAGAGRHSPDVMKSADAREREGRLALGRQDYVAATLAFQAAEASYRKSVAAVPQTPAQESPAAPPLPPPFRPAELREAREFADVMRRRASHTAAAALARPLFDTATAKWARAEDFARKGDGARALGEFKEAGRLWEEARGRATATVAEATERARNRSVAAKAAGTDILFSSLYEAASAKLAQGEELRKREDWAGAVQIYRQAAAGFDDLVTRVEGESRIRAEAEAVKMRRAEALRAGADRFATDLFESASRQEVEAGRLARGTNLAAAIAAYRVAAERYQQAERGAASVK